MGIFDDFKTSLTAETPETQVVNPLGNFGEQQRRLAAEPQSYEQPANGFKPAGQDASAASYPSYPDYSVEEDASLRDQEWIMPEYEGSALYEWIPVIQRAKAENDYEDALTIAYGCMDAMIRVAQENPHNVMDFYVIQLADLYAELGRHDKVIEVISEWLNYNLPAPREDLRLALYKRLAKSQALAVKEAGNSAEICMVYNAEWRRLVEEERTLIENAPDWSHIPITGKALASSKKPVPAAQESSQAGSPETVVPQQLVQAIGAPGQPQPQAPSQPQQAQLQAQQELPQPQAAASFAQIPGNQQPFAQEQFPQPEATQQAAQFNASQYGQEMFGQQSTQFGAPQFGAPQFGAPQFGAPEQSGAPEFEQPQQFGRDPQLRGPEQYGQPQAQQGAQGFGQVPEQLQQPMDFNNQYGAEALSAQHAPNFEEQFAQAGQFGAPAQSQFEASQQFQQAPQFAQHEQGQFGAPQQFEPAPQFGQPQEFGTPEQQQFGGAQFAQPAQEQFQQAPQFAQHEQGQFGAPQQFEPAPQFEQAPQFGQPQQFAQEPGYVQQEQQSQFAQDSSYNYGQQYGQPQFGQPGPTTQQQYNQPGVFEGYPQSPADGQGGVSVPFGIPAETPKQEFSAGAAPQTTQWSSKRYIPEYNFTAGTLLFPMPNFVAVKFEVANRDPKSLCRVVMLKVGHGEVIGKVDSFVRPPAGVRPFEFSNIHGITDQTVEDAPQWPALAMHLRSFVGDYPVWANGAAMHAQVWRSLDDYFGVESRPLEFYDSLLTLYRAEPQMQGVDAAGALEAIAPNARYTPDAFGDALACSAIVQHLNEVNMATIMELARRD